MGGSVKVVIRKEDGTINAMTRWTNSLSYLIHNPDCFKSSESDSLAEYMNSFEEMKLDYEKHKEDKQFELNMTDVYFYEGYDSLAPVDYGIIVMDYKTKTLISSQGYTGENAYLFVRKYKTEHGFTYMPQYHGIDTYNEEELKFHLSKGDILSLSCLKNKNTDKKSILLTGIDTIDKFYDSLHSFVTSIEKSEEPHKDGYFEKPMISLDFNRHGFKTFFYDENDILKVKNKMEEIGFVIPEKDIEEWNKANDRYS